MILKKHLRLEDDLQRLVNNLKIITHDTDPNYKSRESVERNFETMMN